jgi:hypothetical protein
MYASNDRNAKKFLSMARKHCQDLIERFVSGIHELLDDPAVQKSIFRKTELSRI